MSCDDYLPPLRGPSAAARLYPYAEEGPMGVMIHLTPGEVAHLGVGDALRLASELATVTAPVFARLIVLLEKEQDGRDRGAR